MNRDILKSNHIAHDLQHFEDKSLFTPFLCLSPYVRFQKLGYIFPLDPPPHYQKYPWEFFYFAETLPPFWEIFPSYTL